MVPIDLSDIAVLNINDGDNRCFINGASKNEATNLQQKADLNKTSESL